MCANSFAFWLGTGADAVAILRWVWVVGDSACGGGDTGGLANGRVSRSLLAGNWIASFETTVFIESIDWTFCWTIWVWV